MAFLLSIGSMWLHDFFTTIFVLIVFQLHSVAESQFFDEVSSFNGTYISSIITRNVLECLLPCQNDEECKYVIMNVEKGGSMGLNCSSYLEGGTVQTGFRSYIKCGDDCTRKTTAVDETLDDITIQTSIDEIHIYSTSEDNQTSTKKSLTDSGEDLTVTKTPSNSPEMTNTAPTTSTNTPSDLRRSATTVPTIVTNAISNSLRSTNTTPTTTTNTPSDSPENKTTVPTSATKAPNDSPRYSTIVPKTASDTHNNDETELTVTMKQITETKVPSTAARSFSSIVSAPNSMITSAITINNPANTIVPITTATTTISITNQTSKSTTQTRTPTPTKFSLACLIPIYEFTRNADTGSQTHLYSRSAVSKGNPSRVWMSSMLGFINSSCYSLIPEYCEPYPVELVQEVRLVYNSSQADMYCTYKWCDFQGVSLVPYYEYQSYKGYTSRNSKDYTYTEDFYYSPTPTNPNTSVYSPTGQNVYGYSKSVVPNPNR